MIMVTTVGNIVMYASVSLQVMLSFFFFFNLMVIQVIKRFLFGEHAYKYLSIFRFHMADVQGKLISEITVRNRDEYRQ